MPLKPTNTGVRGAEFPRKPAVAATFLSSGSPQDSFFDTTRPHQCPVRLGISAPFQSPCVSHERSPIVVGIYEA